MSTDTTAAPASVDTVHTDILVIGFGRGGKIAAGRLAELGNRVVIVEQSEQMYGGTCPNVGCVPTKALVHQSTKRRPSDPAQEWYAAAYAKVHQITDAFRAGNYEAHNQGTETVLTGHATFVDPHTVVVDHGSSTTTVTGEVILINTGAAPVVPDITGLRDSSYLRTNVDLIYSDQLPERLVIIGGGYLGIEFASIYRHFGSEVTILEASDRLLRREDDDIAEAAIQILTDDGISLITNASVSDVRDDDTGATITYRHHGEEVTIRADAILAAAGRAPVTAGLGLDAAGVELTGRGAIRVDEHLRTSQPHIFALGDVNGGPQFTYISHDDSRIVLDQLIGKGERTTTDRVAVPTTLFMTPPLSRVGLTESDARKAGRRIKVGMRQVADIVAMPRAYVVEETRGVMKFIIDADSDEILGATLLSVDSQELINMVALAMRHGVTATELADGVYTHPSSTEAFNEVIEAIVRRD